MNYIDRYIYAVTRHLPENIRADVEKELRANINDMLPEDPAEEDIVKVLEALGDPSKLAEQYRGVPRCLISPAVFNDYLSTLKLVSAILIVVVIIAGLISNLTDIAAGTSAAGLIVKLVEDMIAGIFSAVSAAFLWVTVTFAAIDYFRLRQNRREKTWSPKNLPTIPAAPVSKIPRSDAIAEIIFTIIFTVIFVRYPHLFGWYGTGGSSPNVIPLFKDIVISNLIPVILLSAMMTVTVAIVKLVYGRWNLLLAGLNSMKSFFGCVFALLLFGNPGSYNENFISRMADALKMDYGTVSADWNNGIRILMLVIVAVSAVEIFLGFYKAYKNKRAAGNTTA